MLLRLLCHAVRYQVASDSTLLDSKLVDRPFQVLAGLDLLIEECRLTFRGPILETKEVPDAQVHPHILDVRLVLLLMKNQDRNFLELCDQFCREDPLLAPDNMADSC